SRLKEGNESARKEYADKLYGAATAMYLNDPQVDLVICGDFNDTPADPSVKEHLHATGDLQAVRTGGERLQWLNLMADKDSDVVTPHYHNRLVIFDQIVVSPGMLDNLGWSCQSSSVQTVSSLAKPGARQRRPWRFGGEKETRQRGYSDHFPVTVKLQ